MQGLKIKTRITRAAMTLLMMMLTTMTAWAETVTVTSSTTNWTSGNTYNATSNVTIGNHVTVTGSVTLTIASGCTLNVNSGITVNDGGMLTVTGSGTLNVSGSDGEDIYDAAGHDTGDPTDGSAGIDGNLTVNSGTVTITGGTGGGTYKKYAPGADGGYGVNGNLTVNGGTVTVTGGTGGKAYNDGNGGNGGYGVSNLLTVNDGNVTVYGGASGSGYFGGTPGYGVSQITVNGGIVLITGGVDSYAQDCGTDCYGNAASDYVSYADTMVAEGKNNGEDDYHLLTGNNSYAAFLRFHPDFFQEDENTWSIYKTIGWGLFCDALQNNDKGFFDGKTVKLGANISVTRMAGVRYKDFTGTFDGQGHTLTVSYGSAGSPINEDNAAPFRYVLGCTIQNLHVTGHIYSSKKNAAGIAGTQYDDVSIINCLSSVTIHSSINDGSNNDGTHGGFVGNHGGGTLNITGCAFTGKMLTTAATPTTCCGGFVGWCNSTTNITNCLYAPAAIENGETEVGITESNTFGRYNKATVNLTNCYYTRTLGTAQGKQARSITVGDTYTTLSNISLSGSTTEYNLSGITAYANGGIKRGSTLYYGSGDPVSFTLSHSDRSGSTFQGYSANNEAISGDSNPYSLTMPDADVVIRTIWSGSPDFLTRGDGNGTSSNPYKITNANDLRDLAIYVNGAGLYSNGFAETATHDCDDVYFKQTVDITLSGEWEPIGTNSNAYKGHYDGGGFAIRGLQVTGNYQYAGLFGVVGSGDYIGSLGTYRQAQLKDINIVDCNINVGTVSSSQAGGIAGKVNTVIMSGCRVSGSITGYGNACGLFSTDATSGVSVTNCFVDVTVSGTGNTYNENIHPKVCLMVSMHAGNGNASSNYYHDNGGNVAVSDNTSINNSATQLYTITGVPTGVTIDTEATVTHGVTNYYAAGDVTLTVTDASKIFDTFSVSGATSSVAANKKSATVTLAASDATVSATLLSITGSCGDNATWSISDTNSDGTYETLTISGTGAITSSPWATDFAASISRVNIGSADLTISGNPFSTLGEGAVIVVPTPAYAISYSSAAFASKLRIALGSYLFTATDEGGTAAYAITSEADLRHLSAVINANDDVNTAITGQGKTFRQTADIDLSSGGNFTPIGEQGIYGRLFKGTYDGGGYTISGLSVRNNSDHSGLFGKIIGATVKNVILVAPTVFDNFDTSRYCHVGALVGYMRDGSRVENSLVIDPTVTAPKASQKYLGAIVGTLISSSSRLTNSHFYSTTDYTPVDYNPDRGKVTNCGRARKVTHGDNVTVSPAASDPANGFVYNNESYYREGLQLTVSVTDPNKTIIEMSTGDGGPSYTLSTDGKSATMSVGDADFTITATLITTSGKTGSVNWALTDEDGNGIYETMTISGTGAMENYRTVSETPWWNFRKDIKSLIVKDGVTRIGTRACTTIGLTTIELPATITSIEGYAFASCSSLTSIEIPASVKRIGESAFSGCTKLVSVTIYAPSLESNGNLGNYMFDNNASGRKIYVFSDCVDTYKNTWNAYKNAFEPITLTANEGATGEYWTTYYNDMADAKAPEGTQVFKASLDGTALTLTPIADGIITRGQAVVLKSTSTSIQPDHSATASADGYSDNDLQGTMKRIENLGDAYVLNKKDSHGVGFYKLSATEHIGAHEAYLLLPAATAPDPIPMVVTLTLADDADNTPALANDMTANVTLQGRTLYKDGDWNTLCLPFDVTLAGSPLEGATVKKFNASTSGVQESTLILNFEDEETTLYAGVPYLIKWEKASDYVDDNAHNLVNPVFTGVTIDKDASTEVTTIDGKVTFQGTYDRKVWNEEDKSVLFVGLNSTLYWPKANGHVNACRAYFQLNDGLTIGSGVTTARMNFEDETTSLSEKGIVNSEKFATATGWYDMRGRKLEGKPTKAGLYIHNGRKTVIK